MKTGRYWHSPGNVYWHVGELIKKTGAATVESEGAYQKVREARTGAVLALALLRMTGEPTYVQLSKREPPDVFIMQLSQRVKGQMDVMSIEITTYARTPSESLLDQLKRTKLKPGIPVLTEEEALLVNIGVGLDVDYEELNDYLNAERVPCQVVTIQEVSNYPDTVARVVFVNPELQMTDINIGEVAARASSSSTDMDVLVVRRVGSTDAVRAERSSKILLAPWETVGL